MKESLDQKITLVCAFRTGSMLGREGETAGGGARLGEREKDENTDHARSLEESALQRGSKSPMPP